jgi:hypothetical protein
MFAEWLFFGVFFQFIVFGEECCGVFFVSFNFENRLWGSELVNTYWFG